MGGALRPCSARQVVRVPLSWSVFLRFLLFRGLAEEVPAVEGPGGQGGHEEDVDKHAGGEGGRKQTCSESESAEDGGTLVRGLVMGLGARGDLASWLSTCDDHQYLSSA